jgi:hypothetical protein
MGALDCWQSELRARHSFADEDVQAIASQPPARVLLGEFDLAAFVVLVSIRLETSAEHVVLAILVEEREILEFETVVLEPCRDLSLEVVDGVRGDAAAFLEYEAIFPDRTLVVVVFFDALGEGQARYVSRPPCAWSP